jgi:hypothetical protein
MLNLPLQADRIENEMSKIQAFATVAALILAGIAGWLTSPSASGSVRLAALNGAKFEMVQAVRGAKDLRIQR